MLQQRNNVDILEILGKRRSIRIYKTEPVPKDILQKILQAGQMAPSACNKQNWKFIIINDESIKQTITDMGGAIFIKKAPVGILVLYDRRTQNIEYQDHIQSAAAAIQNMLITASELGIGACWVCHLPPKRQLRKLLDIPWYFDPIAYIPMGYANCVLPNRPRKCEIENLVSYNKFSSAEPVPKRSIKLIIRIIIIKMYYLLPLGLKKKLLPFIDKTFVTKFE
jgi:nitroreductase